MVADIDGAYQVGSFPGQRWAEWNARFRDDVRRFWRGDLGMTGAFASRLCGRADLYQRSGKAPNSINFVSCHDGFTLNDLVR
jgi:isoamylase